MMIMDATVSKDVERICGVQTVRFLAKYKHSHRLKHISVKNKKDKITTNNSITVIIMDSIYTYFITYF